MRPAPPGRSAGPTPIPPSPTRPGPGWPGIGFPFPAPAALVLCASPLHASTSGADRSRVLWQGPALAGNTVVWGEESGGSGSLYQWTRQRGERVLYRSDSLALTQPLAVSRTFLAFAR